MESFFQRCSYSETRKDNLHPFPEDISLQLGNNFFLQVIAGKWPFSSLPLTKKIIYNYNNARYVTGP